MHKEAGLVVAYSVADPDRPPEKITLFQPFFGIGEDPAMTRDADQLILLWNVSDTTEYQ